jgi:hypothetical protein
MYSKNVDELFRCGSSLCCQSGRCATATSIATSSSSASTTTRAATTASSASSTPRPGVDFTNLKKKVFGQTFNLHKGMQLWTKFQPKIIAA